MTQCAQGQTWHKWKERQNKITKPNPSNQNKWGEEKINPKVKTITFKLCCRSLSHIRPAAHWLIANPTRIPTARHNRTSTWWDFAEIMFCSWDNGAEWKVPNWRVALECESLPCVYSHISRHIICDMYSCAGCRRLRHFVVQLDVL